MTRHVVVSVAEDVPVVAKPLARLLTEVIGKAFDHPKIGADMALSLGFSAAIREYLRCFGVTMTVEMLHQYANTVAVASVMTTNEVSGEPLVTVPDHNYRLSQECSAFYRTLALMIVNAYTNPAIGRNLTFSVAFSTLMRHSNEHYNAAVTAAMLRNYAETTPMVDKMNQAAGFPEGHA